MLSPLEQRQIPGGRGLPDLSESWTLVDTRAAIRACLAELTSSERTLSVSRRFERPDNATLLQSTTPSSVLDAHWTTGGPAARTPRLPLKWMRS